MAPAPPPASLAAQRQDCPLCESTAALPAASVPGGPVAAAPAVAAAALAGAMAADGVIWRDDFLRVVVAGDPDIPALVRVICNAHVREMSDLAIAERSRLMRTVLVVEDALRAALAPDKINLASLGNLVPHLHWHVIPRFVRDAHFPQPIWGTRRREADADLLARQRAALPVLYESIARKLDAMRTGAAPGAA